MQTTTIRKWGNSYAVRLPKAAVGKMRLAEGQTVRVEETDGGRAMKLVPATRRSEPLGKLLERVTPKNAHRAVAWGKPVGAEIW
jgi:antitoxin MazE